MLNINDANQDYGMPLLRLAFRPFFLGAAIYAVLSILLWMGFYVFGIEHDLSGLSSSLWHGHEMIFGYAIAVIAGFLLTAIKNWTGQQTINGNPLALLFLLWLLARLFPLTGMADALIYAAIADISFMIALALAAATPILRAKQYAQLLIITIVFLLLCCNVLFYLGVFGVVEQGVNWGLYSAVYLVVLLILVMARRVVPFFIQNGVEENVELKNWKWLDASSVILFIALWLSDVFGEMSVLTSWLALVLVVLHTIRLTLWHTKGIWKKSLLWVIYLAYGFIVLGFALKASELFFATPGNLYLHAFTYGGVGVMTMGMMARVILGHTGRNVFEPPAIISYCFILLIAGSLARVVLPLFSMEWYLYWIGLSQLLWVLSFSLFLTIYAPMLWSSRIDGRDG